MYHARFVSALCVLPFSGPSLVSAGGDAELYVWNWMTGTLRAKIPIFDHVKPFIVVSGNKMRREARELARARFQEKRKTGKKRSSKKKVDDLSALADDASPEPGLESAEMEGVEEEQEGLQPDTPGALLLAVPSEGAADEEEPMVVSNLSFFTTASGSSVLVWSVVGYVDLLH